MAHSYRLVFLVLFCFNPIRIQAQSPSKKGFYDFVFLDKNTVCLLTTSGKIAIASTKATMSSSPIHTDTTVVALAVDRQGNLIIGDNNHQIKKFNKTTKQWSTFANYKNKLTGIVFDSQNTCFVITDKGVFDTSKAILNFPDSTKYLNDQIRNKKEWFVKPVFFLDKRDKLWLGFDYGEWGGDVFCFDTRQQMYVPLQIDSVNINLNPVSGFCEDQQHTYMSGGLSHMFMTNGAIFKFAQHTAKPLLLAGDRETPLGSAMRVDPTTGKKTKVKLSGWRGGEYIGPIAYNSANKCLYFYSQNGIHKGDLTKDLSIIKNWRKVLKPTLQWTGGRPNAAGPAMNVLKMQFDSSGTLFFLTEHDGLGLYDGKQLRFVK